MKKGIISVLSVIAGGAIGAAVVNKISNNKVKFWKNTSNKHLEMIKLYDQWMAAKKENKSVVNFFRENNYKTVAIYGMSYIGERLCEELKDSDIEVKYGIDRNAENVQTDIRVITPEDDFEKVDVIVVTAFFFYDEIEELLSEKTDIEIVSIEDVLFVD